MSALSRLQAFYLGKFVVITGGSEGIGLATAAELVSLGANVLIASRNRAKLDHALGTLEPERTRPDQRIASETLDVTDFESTRNCLAAIVSTYGSPDILINSAGLARPGYLEVLDIADLKTMIDVNYFGTVNTVKALLPAMRQAGRGHIVNISSMAGYLGLFGYTGYCASKYAVIGFSGALRQELRPLGIHVSVVCPPNTQTPGLEIENRTKPPEVRALDERVKTASASEVAHALLRALPRHPFLIHPTRYAHLVYLAMRLSPTWLADIVLRRQL